MDDLTAPDRVVILTTISGVPFGEAWSSRAPGDLGGRPVNFLGWDDLIRNKTASGRDKDQLDVKTLLKIAAQKRKGYFMREARG